MPRSHKKNVNDYSDHQRRPFGGAKFGIVDRKIFESERLLEYIEAMTSELSTLASDQDQEFLAYLLKLAVFEARAAKVRVVWSACQSQK